MAANTIAEEFKVQVSNLLTQSTSKIHHCLNQLDEAQVWLRPANDMNSIGNLILHICGNLEQWCFVAFTDATDERDRDAEFSGSVVLTKLELLSRMDQTVTAAQQTIDQLDKNCFLEVRLIQGFEVSAMEALLHTTSHFQGHTHQIILMTRMLKKESYKFHWLPEDGRESLPM